VGGGPPPPATAAAGPGPVSAVTPQSSGSLYEQATTTVSLDINYQAHGILFSNGGTLTTAPSGLPYYLSPQGGPTSGLKLTMGIPFHPIPTKAYTSVVFPGDSYSTWLALYPTLPGTGPNDNTDGDPNVNFLEYFGDTNPKNTQSYISTDLEVKPGQVVVRYQKSKNLAHTVSDQITWSTNLVDWHTTGVTYDPDHDLGPHLQRVARVPVAAGVRNIFIRLEVNDQ
jgi:hypothetical protein